MHFFPCVFYVVLLLSTLHTCTLDLVINSKFAYIQLSALVTHIYQDAYISRHLFASSTCVYAYFHMYIQIVVLCVWCIV